MGQRGRAVRIGALCAGAAAVGATAFVLVFLPAAQRVPEAEFFGRWELAAAFTLAFTAFLVAFVVRPRARNWRELGASEAFFVALFTEMFGAPLTVYLLSAAGAGTTAGFGPQGHLLAGLAAAGGPPPAQAIAVVMLASTTLVVAGVCVAAAGWLAVHNAGQGGLVERGLYARCRHPQYLGFLMVILGFLVMWPTLLTLAMAPILAVAYVRLARREERELAARFAGAYRAYAARVPFMLPRLREAPPHGQGAPRQALR